MEPQPMYTGVGPASPPARDASFTHGSHLYLYLFLHPYLHIYLYISTSTCLYLCLRLYQEFKQ